MALRVVVAAAVAANTPFTVTVPAQERWTVLSVCATVSRAVGGTPNRVFQLGVSDGTTTFLTSPAMDTGTEPGTGTVTWCNGAPATVSSGSSMITLGPLTPIVINPGYQLVGTVLHGAAADQWTRAVVWVDETAWRG